MAALTPASPTGAHAWGNLWGVLLAMPITTLRSREVQSQMRSLLDFHRRQHTANDFRLAPVQVELDQRTAELQRLVITDALRFSNQTRRRITPENLEGSHILASAARAAADAQSAAHAANNAAADAVTASTDSRGFATAADASAQAAAGAREEAGRAQRGAATARGGAEYHARQARESRGVATAAALAGREHEKSADMSARAAEGSATRAQCAATGADGAQTEAVAAAVEARQSRDHAATALADGRGFAAAADASAQAAAGAREEAGRAQRGAETARGGAEYYARKARESRGVATTAALAGRQHAADAESACSRAVSAAADAAASASRCLAIEAELGQTLRSAGIINIDHHDLAVGAALRDAISGADTGSGQEAAAANSSGDQVGTGAAGSLHAALTLTDIGRELGEAAEQARNEAGPGTSSEEVTRRAIEAVAQRAVNADPPDDQEEADEPGISADLICTALGSCTRSMTRLKLGSIDAQPSGGGDSAPVVDGDEDAHIDTALFTNWKLVEMFNSMHPRPSQRPLCFTLSIPISTQRLTVGAFSTKPSSMFAFNFANPYRHWLPHHLAPHGHFGHDPRIPRANVSPAFLCRSWYQCHSRPRGHVMDFLYPQTKETINNISYPPSNVVRTHYVIRRACSCISLLARPVWDVLCMRRFSQTRHRRDRDNIPGIYRLFRRRKLTPATGPLGRGPVDRERITA